MDKSKAKPQATKPVSKTTSNIKPSLNAKSNAASKNNVVATKPAAGASAKTSATIATDAAPVNKVEAAAASKIEAAIVKEIKLKEITRIIDDNDDSIKSSGKCALIIDSVGNVKTFLRHTSVNYVNCTDPFSMKPDTLRRAVIGAIRFNKPLALDIEDRDIGFWVKTKEAFDEIHKDLLEKLINSKILENDEYLKLAKVEIDGEDYRDFYFTNINSFKLIILTENENFDPLFLHKFSVFKIIQ